MESLACKNCNQAFSIEPDEISFYASLGITRPKLCPECRYQRRIANRNEWNLYKRPCSLCKKDIVSIYNPDYSGPVYCAPCFWSDNWDASDYAQQFDFSKPFFEQFKEFRFKVPRLAITNAESVNSEYTNQAQGNKDCYMIVASNKSENCLYGNWYQGSKYSVDCYMAEKSELLYECMNCASCFGSTYLQNCSDCHSSHFLKDCRGCSDCFGCVCLKNKQYCWFNKEVGKDEYLKLLESFVWNRDNILQTREKLRELDLTMPHKYYEGRANVNSTGDYLENNKNVRTSFNCRHTEDIKYCQDAWWSKNSMDITEVFADFSYELEGVIASRSMALSRAWNVYDSFYSELCFNSNDLFGCMGLNKKEYCIFNTQYSKEEYLALKEKIVAHMKETGEWGEFFPIEISPFPYNDTVAEEYFPLSKEEVLTKGWKWYERDVREYKVTLQPKRLPAEIRYVDASITKEIIGCANQGPAGKGETHHSCATAFRVTPAELEFYKRMNIPLPDKCFPCRRQARFALRNPRHLWARACQCEGAKSETGKYMNVAIHAHDSVKPHIRFETSYAPERPEIIYCESCYQSEVA